jgi:hypothetical protein
MLLQEKPPNPVLDLAVVLRDREAVLRTMSPSPPIVPSSA